MATALQPWQILVATFAGWISRHQDAVIEYLQEENRVLEQQLGRRRLRLTDDQRRRLTARGKAIGRRALAEVASLVHTGHRSTLASTTHCQEVDPQATVRRPNDNCQHPSSTTASTPAPERSKRTAWSQFLKAHWNVLAAADFFTVEVWAPRGLVTFYVFFVIELSTGSWLRRSF